MTSPIPVFVDNNVWDLFFSLNLNLESELPPNDFAIFITREAEFELAPLKGKKPLLWDYIQQCITKCMIRTDSFFGFFQEGFSAEDQRVAGFNRGRWISEREAEFISKHRGQTSSNRPTRLFKQEADLSLAARSFGGVVLTLDAKPGPLRTAEDEGGKVLFLGGINLKAHLLRELIERAWS